MDFTIGELVDDAIVVHGGPKNSASGIVNSIRTRKPKLDHPKG